MTLSSDPSFASPGGAAQSAVPESPPDGKRWSRAAIAAFVLSLLGCLGFTAILGLIFAVVGVTATRGGRRRGLGLAIVAIPLSVITGIIGFVMIVVFALGGQSLVASRQVGSLLASGVVVSSQGGFQELCSKDLRKALEGDEFATWLGNVQAEQGSFVELSKPPMYDSRSPEGELRFTGEAKFVNGPATIRLTFQYERWWRWVVSNIEIDGVSPRSPP